MRLKLNTSCLLARITVLATILALLSLNEVQAFYQIGLHQQSSNTHNANTNNNRNENLYRLMTAGTDSRLLVRTNNDVTKNVNTNTLSKIDSQQQRLSSSSSSSSLSSSTRLFSTKRFKNFEQVLDMFHEEPVVIYFTTPKCGPCHLMKKELVTVRESVGDKLKLFSVDTEKWPHVGSRFKVAKLPCLVVFQAGQVLLKFEGVTKAEDVVSALNKQQQ